MFFRQFDFGNNTVDFKVSVVGLARMSRPSML